MKISNHLILGLVFFLFFACTGGAGKKDGVFKKDAVGKEVTASQQEEDVHSDEENFDQFIRKFSDQESFQLARIKFPLSVIVPDAEDEGMASTEEVIGRYDWELLDLTYDSTYLTRAFDQYYQGVRFGKDTAVVEIRGINNGIYADYYFTLIDKKWYLVTLYEASF